MQELNVNDQITLSFSATNHQGDAKLLGGIPIWTTSDASLISLHPSADGYKCIVKGNKPGRCKVTVQALGSKNIAHTIDLIISSPYADMIKIHYVD